jgi:hypothetical protein
VAAQAERGNGVVLSGEFSGIRVAYLATDRELGVITEIFSGTPSADLKPDATYPWRAYRAMRRASASRTPGFAPSQAQPDRVWATDQESADQPREQVRRIVYDDGDRRPGWRDLISGLKSKGVSADDAALAALPLVLEFDDEVVAQSGA